jgi:hypothetical protein
VVEPLKTRAADAPLNLSRKGISSARQVLHEVPLASVPATYGSHNGLQAGVPALANSSAKL